jgi:hypothetical protein
MDTPKDPKPIGEVGKAGGGVKSGPGTNTSSNASTSPADAGTRTDPGPGTKSGAGAKAGTIPGQISQGDIRVGLPPEPPDFELNLPQPKVKTPVKPKSQKKEINELSDNFHVLIKSAFDLIALRAGKIWEISDFEAEQIARPLAAVCDDFGWLNTTSKYANIFGLTMAVGIVFTPRIIISFKDRPQRRVPDAPIRPIAKDAKGSDGSREDDKPTTNASADSVSELRRSLPC